MGDSQNWRRHIGVEQAIFVAVNAHANAGARWNAHDGEAIAVLDFCGQLGSGQRHQVGAVGSIVCRAGLIEQAVEATVESSLYDKIDVGGSGLGFEQ